MARPPKAFDVWFVAANTVYRQVPYQVVADWTQQGRLAPADMLRPAGTQDEWRRVDAVELLADYLPRPAATAVAARPGAPPAEVPEPVDDFRPRRRRGDEDDDVDMIPLIDISMVLLVFFIIISATGALSPVDVPDMRYAGQRSADANAVTIAVEQAAADRVAYSVRVGERPPRPEHSGLADYRAAAAVLDELRPGLPRPPDVRIACEKALPSERVFELIRELKARKDKGQINSFTAEVNEAPKP